MIWCSAFNLCYHVCVNTNKKMWLIFPLIPSIWVYLDISSMMNTSTLTVLYTLVPIKHISIEAMAAL